MFALERQKRIVELLERDGAVWVSKLSQEFSVAEETVRRDLEKLEKQEILIRTHGGAVPIDENNVELSLERRKQVNLESKEKLGQKACEYIMPGDTVFLDASTTTFYIAKYLKKMNNVTVITNSIRVINELSGVEGIKVIGVGGKVSSNQSFVGSLTEQIIEKNYFANKVFFSSKGVSATQGILEGNEQECGIKQKMMKNSKETFCLFDKSKLGRIGFEKLVSFEDIDYFITDAETLPEDLMNAFNEYNVKCEITK